MSKDDHHKQIMNASLSNCIWSVIAWFHTLKAKKLVENTNSITEISNSTIITRIRAVWFCPDSSSCASSLFICLSCNSFLFLNNFNREDASFNDVLLHYHIKHSSTQIQPHIYTVYLRISTFESINKLPFSGIEAFCERIFWTSQKIAWFLHCFGSI